MPLFLQLNDLRSCLGTQVGLALAFILPAALNRLIEQGVAAELVLGSASASGFAGWQVADQSQAADEPVIHYDL